MSFRRISALAGVLFVGIAFAQSESEPAAEITAAPDPAPAAMVELADDSTPPSPGDASAGQTKSATCVACHGIDGNSSDPQYPKLAGQHEHYLARHLALYKTGERENAIMRGFAMMLSPQDMRDLGAYFSTQSMMPGLADESVIAEGPYQGRKFYEVGESLYRGGDLERGIPACLACHGPTGLGNPGPAYPAVGGQHANYTVQQLTAFRDGAVYGDGDNANEIMAGVARYLTDEEIQALASYIEGLHLAEPASGTVATN